MTHDCPACGRRFGGTSAYDRHVDRRRDRCKTEAALRRIGIVADTEGVYHRAAIAAQAPLVDKRSVPRTAQRTRRGRATGRAQRRSGTTPQDAGSGAEEPAPRPVQGVLA